MSRRLSSPSSSRQHLGDRVGEYADRELPAAELLACDRHVAICTGCRYAAAQEQQMLQALRRPDVPGLGQGLQAALLQLAAYSTPAPAGSARAPLQAARAQLPTVRRSAPPMHRSARRAVVVASVVAGACAAAACALATAAPSDRAPGPLSNRTLANSGIVGASMPAAFVVTGLRVPFSGVGPAQSRP